METTDVLDTLKTIKFETPVNKIINQLKELIIHGHLKPGDRLPAERLLAEKFGVGRGYIREAIMKLEFFGLLKTSPQSGTYVSGFSLKIMDTLFSDIIKFNKDDFNSLVEGRFYLEINSARLAAVRRNDRQIAEMQEALADFDRKIINGDNATDEDMLFHIKIAGATRNSFIESMLLILVPDLITTIYDRKICRSEDSLKAIKMHHRILDAIIAKDADTAGEAMRLHLEKGFHVENL